MKVNVECGKVRFLGDLPCWRVTEEICPIQTSEAQNNTKKLFRRTVLITGKLSMEAKEFL